MNILQLEELSTSQYAQLIERPRPESTEIGERVLKILEDVKQKGDEALFAYTRDLDGVELTSLSVDTAKIAGSTEAISEDMKSALQTAHERISAFHAQQRPLGYEIEPSEGVRLQQAIRPFARVGIYVPKNLISSLLMAAIPARLAGVREIIVCTPPDKTGEVSAGIRAACNLLSINQLFAVGGAQAIAAMAYGTASIPNVNLIAGPGNAYVTAAKALVRDEVKIDMLAGPSEILLVVEDVVNFSSQELASWAIAELKAQLEHGPGTSAYLLSSNKALADSVSSQLSSAETESRNVAILHYTSRERLWEFVNAFAPEHLAIWSNRARELLDGVQNAGSVFLGPWSPVALGDYASGTNHILPTSRNARFTGGLSVETFVKRISVQEISPAGLNTLAPAVMRLAQAEGLPEHAQSVQMRVERETNA